jgi:hypothetical protein
MLHSEFNEKYILQSECIALILNNVELSNDGLIMGKVVFNVFSHDNSVKGKQLNNNYTFV